MPDFAKAKINLVDKSGKATGKVLDVHFNPASLVYEVTNTLKEEGRGQSRGQYVTQNTGKLTVDLIFDNTHSGEDIRATTQRIVDLASNVQTTTEKDPKNRKEVLPTVQFEWGLYTFIGVIETLKETIDYFSPDGVPLRSVLNLKFSEKSHGSKAQSEQDK